MKDISKVKVYVDRQKTDKTGQKLLAGMSNIFDSTDTHTHTKNIPGILTLH
jgi:hypothetical protein